MSNSNRKNSIRGNPRLRGRVSVEINGRTGLTEAGADLLEQIVISGSLSEAARQLHYSYRYAWLLVDSINRTWGRPLVRTATGGRHGGGAELTELGQAVLSSYRHLQIELEHFLDLKTKSFSRGIKSPP